MTQDRTEASDDDAESDGIRLTHAQPLVPGSREGEFVARPLLSPAEAEAEAFALDGDIDIEFGPLDEVAFGLYTHRLRVVSGPEHLCRHYLVRLAR